EAADMRLPGDRARGDAGRRQEKAEGEVEQEPDGQEGDDPPIAQHLAQAECRAPFRAARPAAAERSPRREGESGRGCHLRRDRGGGADERQGTVGMKREMRAGAGRRAEPEEGEEAYRPEPSGERRAEGSEP